MAKATQGQIDAANEWTAEHYPEATDEEFEVHFAAALADIVAIDAAADLADKRAA